MEDLKKKKYIIVISIISTLIILLGSVYAFFTYYKSALAFTLTSNSISATFSGGTNQINFTNAYPISDEYALENLNKLDYIDFTVTGSASNENEAITYEIFLTEANGNTLSNNFIKTYVTDNNGNQVTNPSIYGTLPTTTYSNEPTGKVVIKKTYADEFEKSYRLYIWLDKDYTQNELSQTFSFYVNLYAYNDIKDNSSILNINYNPKGGTLSSLTDIKDKELVTYGILSTPIKNGYTFAGWYLENTYQTLINEDSIMPNLYQIELYAKYDVCSIGYYCKDGEKKVCPAGTYCPNQGTINPTYCQAGKWGSTGRTSQCTDNCQAGYYCKDGRKNVCPAGYYCPAGSASANTCPAGYYCPARSTSGTANKCRAGYYCPQGSSSETKCPAGTYNPSTGQTSSSSCRSCPAGYYCPEGSTSGTARICPAGYYCPEGSTSGTTNKCPAGTYNPYAGKSESSSCLTCPNGTTSKAGATSCS